MPNRRKWVFVGCTLFLVPKALIRLGGVGCMRKEDGVSNIKKSLNKNRGLIYLTI